MEIRVFDVASGEARQETLPASAEAHETSLAATAYQRQRAAAYPSVREVVEALAEKEEGRPEKWAAISATRQEVRAAFPKGGG